MMENVQHVEKEHIQFMQQKIVTNVHMDIIKMKKDKIHVKNVQKDVEIVKKKQENVYHVDMDMDMTRQQENV